MDDQLTVCQQMALVRNRGLENASDLHQEVQRLTDWREHVRSYPMQAVVAAAAFGYWIVPPKHARTDLKNADSSTVGQIPGTGPVEGRSGVLGSFAGAALGFVGSLAANALRSYLYQQVQSLIHVQGSHGLQDQRQASSARN